VAAFASFMLSRMLAIPCSKLKLRGKGRKNLSWLIKQIFVMGNLQI